MSDREQVAAKGKGPSGAPTTRDVRLRAAELIERKGWIQGAWSTPQGRSLPAALSDAVFELCGVGKYDPDTGQGDYSDAAVEMALALGKATRYEMRHRLGCHYLSRWNDDKQRTKDDVLNALRGGLE